MRLRFQFGLRTLLVLTAAVALLFSQWPLVMNRVTWAFVPEANAPHGAFIVAPEAHPFIPPRVWIVVSVEAAALVAWGVWRWARSRAATRPPGL